MGELFFLIVLTEIRRNKGDLIQFKMMCCKTMIACFADKFVAYIISLANMQFFIQ